MQPVQVALQDGDPNTGWRPFEKGADYVRLTSDIALSRPNIHTQVHIILTVSDISCYGGGLFVYYQISNAADEGSVCGREVDLQECAFVSEDDGGQKCTFSCNKWCDRDYLRVFTLFQRWMQVDPVILDLSVELFW